MFIFSHEKWRTRAQACAFTAVLWGLLPNGALAACSWTVLANGTSADATQVQDNLDCLAHKAGPVFSGFVGIGTTPAYVLDVHQNIAGDAIVRVHNPDAGGAAAAKVIAENNDSKTVQLAMLGGNFTPPPSGIFKPNGAVLYSNGSGGITLDTGLPQPIYFGINNAEVAQLNANGYLLLGYTTSAGSYRLQVNSQIYAASATIATSDRRLKNERSTPSADLLDAVMGVPVRLYTRKDHPEYGVRAGYWAQDWLKVFKANGIGAGGKSGSTSAGMVPLNADGYLGLDEGAVQALKIAALERRLAQITDEMESLRTLVERQRTAIATSRDGRNVVRANYIGGGSNVRR